jgi:hypothetical protein
VSLWARVASLFRPAAAPPELPAYDADARIGELARGGSMKVEVVIDHDRRGSAEDRAEWSKMAAGIDASLGAPKPPSLLEVLAKLPPLTSEMLDCTRPREHEPAPAHNDEKIAKIELAMSADQQLAAPSRADEVRKKLGIAPPPPIRQPTIDEVLEIANKQISDLDAQLASSRREFQQSQLEAHRLERAEKLLSDNLKNEVARSEALSSWVDEMRRVIDKVIAALEVRGAPLHKRRKGYLELDERVLELPRYKPRKRGVAKKRRRAVNKR